jgi:ABC-2 type transport system ATP-binding protein
MAGSTPILQIEGLTKKYGDFVALDGLTLSLDRGQILGFIGPNGAGKTTTIRILVGQSRPTAGRASIAGADCVRDARRIKRLVGYMPDMFGVYDNMRVHEYLDFFGAAYSIPRRDRVKRIAEVLETTGIDYKDQFVEALSHGMKQRVAVARTLLHDPEVLILDEPANGLDPQARIDMRHLLRRLADQGKTLIVTSHILPELARICDQVAIMTRGKLRAMGTVDQIMRNLTQRRIFEVQCSAAGDVETAADIVRREEAEVAEVTVVAAEHIVRFQTSRTDDELNALLAQLVNAEVGVCQFREVVMDLEDTFLTITRAAETAN